jgi:hypothetical protein
MYQHLKRMMMVAILPEMFVQIYQSMLYYNTFWEFEFYKI